jgi:putative component of membrane protein insertase Oxa1/YidC/SpoIIIJ protein YidD
VPLILRVLAWLIVLYRRWLSGRGPLRDVRCSFAPHESCSAFGLRATSESSGGLEALGKIRRRIRRCRDACLISDGHALSWTALHDRDPGEIVGDLRADGEGDAAIEKLLHARRAVAIWRSDVVAIAACDALLADPARPRPPRVVAEPAMRSRARRRLIVLGVFAVVAAIAIVGMPWIGGVALGATSLAGVVSAQATVSRERRFELHRTWAQRR